MGSFINRVGDVYGELTVKQLYSRSCRIGNKKTLWTCECSCGNISNYSASNLVTGNSTCCLECRPEKQVVHGNSRRGKDSLTYRSWQHMKDRCLNPNTDMWKYYGGRGIKVCDRWSESFENFLEDMGERPCKELTLDRINTDGNYEPSNCRWADKLTQTLNRRINYD